MLYIIYYKSHEKNFEPQVQNPDPKIMPPVASLDNHNISLSGNLAFFCWVAPDRRHNSNLISDAFLPPKSGTRHHNHELLQSFKTNSIKNNWSAFFSHGVVRPARKYLYFLAPASLQDDGSMLNSLKLLDYYSIILLDYYIIRWLSYYYY